MHGAVGLWQRVCDCETRPSVFLKPDKCKLRPPTGTFRKVKRLPHFDSQPRVQNYVKYRDRCLASRPLAPLQLWGAPGFQTRSIQYPISSVFALLLKALKRVHSDAVGVPL